MVSSGAIDLSLRKFTWGEGVKKSRKKKTINKRPHPYDFDGFDNCDACALWCCRRGVRARLSAGAAHTGVHDRGRHIRHDQNGVAAVPAGEVAAVQQAPAPGHGHARGHGVVDGLADRVRRAHRVPGRLVRAGQLLDAVRVLAGLGAVVAVRAERVVQPHAVRHQPGAPGLGVRGRRDGAGRRRGRARVPAVRAPVQIAYGHRDVVRLRGRLRPRSPDDRHRHTAVQRHPH